jgi:heptosyltransferase-2
MSVSHDNSVSSILLITLSCIGDVVLTTPVMRVLKETYPAAKLTVAAGPTAAPILSRHEWVDRLVIFDNKGKHKGAKGAARLALDLRAHKYDIVVDLRNSMIPYLVRARRRITSHKAHLKNQNNLSRHAIDRHLDVLESAGMTVTGRDMKITIPGDVDAKVAAFMAERGICGPGLIAISPGAGSSYKLYPQEKFAAVIELLKNADDYKYVAVGSSVDSKICDYLVRAAGPRAVSVAGQLDILELAALLRRCDALIANDSGPMHIGAAVGVPTVAVFGPTNAERYGPRGPLHRIVWHRENCNPCKAPECGRDSCVGDIPPESIADAAKDILSKKHV